MLYLINYQVQYQVQPGARRNIPQVIQNIEQAIISLGDWWHYLPGTWIVNTSLTAEQLARYIYTHLSEQERDYLFVTAIRGPMFGWIPTEAWDWINARL